MALYLTDFFTAALANAVSDAIRTWQREPF